MQPLTNVNTREDRAPTIRRPTQKRGKERFEAILDATDRLLAGQEPSELSIYSIAKEAGVSAQSVYHFFPDTDCVFLALAERLNAVFIGSQEAPPEEAKRSWQTLLDYRFKAARDLYNETPAARKLLLGSGLSAALRARDMEFDRRFATRGAEELRNVFQLPEFPNLVNRLTELLAINDSIWALSVHRHGIITEELEEQARRARVAYARTFLPEYLDPKP
ncbi:TetR/AcrR family transcriptional regulator [Parahaliea mediterranea]|uniref:TetR/AcrR family transcriptional regulator n=1 Tax=Parahaliea mediterranea TaxID=651086 RepID=A0A939IKR6_9GAMM|nr:TetR/AcrR family transcriptional regulator [Parahaliea mediterranea]MBN7799049.1 TetR/AcrR family transcriptional regulator [Parahaliea mediterranea]